MQNFKMEIYLKIISLKECK